MTSSHILIPALPPSSSPRALNSPVHTDLQTHEARALSKDCRPTDARIGSSSFMTPKGSSGITGGFTSEVYFRIITSDRNPAGPDFDRVDKPVVTRIQSLMERFVTQTWILTSVSLLRKSSTVELNFYTSKCPLTCQLYSCMSSPSRHNLH